MLNVGSEPTDGGPDGSAQGFVERTNPLASATKTQGTEPYPCFLSLAAVHHTCTRTDRRSRARSVFVELCVAVCAFDRREQMRGCSKKKKTKINVRNLSGISCTIPLFYFKWHRVVLLFRAGTQHTVGRMRLLLIRFCVHFLKRFL